MANLRVLCAESDAPLRRVLISIINCALEEHQVVTYTCKDEEEFLERADPLNYQLYVIGYNLPKMSGSEMLEKLRKRGDETPTLIMGHEETTQSDYRKIGREAYLTKTLTIGNLKSAFSPLIKDIEF